MRHLIDSERTVLQAHARALHDTTRLLPQIRAHEDQDLLPFPAGSLKHFESTNDVKEEFSQEGVKEWFELLVIVLNSQFSGASVEAAYSVSQMTTTHIEAAKFLVRDVVLFLKDHDGKLPPQDFEATLKSSAVTYNGEEVFPSEMLNIDRVREGLPKVGAGGMVDVLEVSEGLIRHKLSNPRNMLLADGECDDLPTRMPKVWADHQTFVGIAKLLIAAGIAIDVPLPDVAKHRGRRITHGCFAVGKGGFKRGEGPQRFVVNMPALNAITEVIEGDMASLPMCNTWHALFLDDNEVVLISSDDLKCAFYIFRLPLSWAPYLCFSEEMTRAELYGAGCERPDVLVCVALIVVPMGWNSATGVIQHVHRRLARLAGLPRSLEVRRDRPLRQAAQVMTDRTEVDQFFGEALMAVWQIYLDNLDLMEVVDARELARWIGTTSGAQQAMRDLYDEWSIARSTEKAVLRETTGKLLGVQLRDGHRLTGPTPVVQAVVQLTLHTLARPRVTKKWLQILLGRWVRLMQLELATSSAFDEVWLHMATWKGSQPLSQGMRDELWSALALLPLMFTNLRLPVDGMVLVSDASETGGAFCRSSGLTSEGLRALGRWTHGGRDLGADEILLISLFDGVGGARRAFELCRVGVSGYAASEVCPHAKRVVQYAWPGRIDLGGVEELTGDVIEELLLRFAHARVVVLMGGSPCKGLSGANPDRKGLHNVHSKLFLHIPRILDILRKQFPLVQLEFLFENVASMRKRDRRIFAEMLGVVPILVRANRVTHCRRPRLYWISWATEVDWAYPMVSRGDHLELLLPDEPGPRRRWLSSTAAWKSAEADARLPSFLRSRPSKRRPFKPTGIDTCNPRTVHRWEKDDFRFSPYLYKEQNMISENGKLRQPNALEKEKLLDFAPRHTLTCMPTRARNQQQRELEDTRVSLLGDSFQCLCVAQLLMPMLVRRGYATEHLTPAQMRGSDLKVSPGLLRGASGGELQKALARAHIASCDPRGSDVRIDVGEPFDLRSWPRRPIDVDRWNWQPVLQTRWRHSDPITILEALASHLALLWRSRFRDRLRSRFLHLIDNQATIAVLAKHRSRSQRLNNIVRKSSAILLASGVRRALGYTETDRNPADVGSRSFSAE